MGDDRFKSSLGRSSSRKNSRFRRSKGECWNCGKIGHFRSECKAPRKSDSGG